MPRQARLDVPGALHHVMGRGIERGTLFRGNRDRQDFLERLGSLAEEGLVLVYAWALMPNHFHLLLRSTATPLSRIMRKLMTGYAVGFNLRHDRVGHLFQNRFKSVLCQDEPYFMELVRYIHLNPLRAGLVPTLTALDGSTLTGHAVLMGRRALPWQRVDDVLGRFAQSLSRARAAYRDFMEEGIAKPEPKHLEGGGLIRSVGGWKAVAELRRGREGHHADERVLGEGDFVTGLLKESDREQNERERLAREWGLERLIPLVCEHTGISPRSLSGGGKVPAVVKAREGLSYLWVKRLAQSGGDLARATGMKSITVYHAAKRGEARGEAWKALLS